MDTFDFFLVCDECKKELSTGFFEGDNDICFDCKVVKDVDKLNIHDWKSILSIDIGIDHLGLSLSHIDSEYNFREVVWIKLINIQNFECEDSCPLQHEKTITDWISHVIFKYKDVRVFIPFNIRLIGLFEDDINDAHYIFVCIQYENLQFIEG